MSPRDTPRLQADGQSRNRHDADSLHRAQEGLSLDGAPMLLTVSEASDALRISRWALYQLINKRRLKSVLIGRRRLIPQDDLQQFIAELRAQGGVDV